MQFVIFQPSMVPKCAFIPPSVCQISRKSDVAFAFYGSFVSVQKKKNNKKKNEETKPIFEVAYLRNA